jgi:hypothetical protein
MVAACLAALSGDATGAQRRVFASWPKERLVDSRLAA